MSLLLGFWYARAGRHIDRHTDVTTVAILRTTTWGEAKISMPLIYSTSHCVALRPTDTYLSQFCLSFDVFQQLRMVRLHAVILSSGCLRVHSCQVSVSAVHIWPTARAIDIISLWRDGRWLISFSKPTNTTSSRTITTAPSYSTVKIWHWKKRKWMIYLFCLNQEEVY